MRLFICLLMLGGASALGQVMTFQSDGNATVREVSVDDPSSTPIDLLANDGAPTEFPHGIAIPDSSSSNPVYEIGVENGAVVTWVAHASPYDPAVAESNRVAALADRSTLRHALRVLKGVAQTNKAQVQATTALTNGFTAAENRALVNDLRRELIDANDSIIELTRLVRKLLKEQNP